MKSILLSKDKDSGVFTITAPESEFTMEGSKLVVFPRDKDREYKLKVSDPVAKSVRTLLPWRFGTYRGLIFAQAASHEEAERWVHAIRDTTLALREHGASDSQAKPPS